MLCVMEDWMRIKLLSLFCGAVLGVSLRRPQMLTVT